MELSHENIQKLHREVRTWKTINQGTTVTADDGMQYEIINSENSVTEAIAVAPIVNNKTDYSRTIVLTAGTQNKFNPLKDSFGEIATTVESVSGAADAAYGSGLSPQYAKMDEFFAETQKRLEDKGVKGGQIWYSSAHSQAGVPNAKLSVKYRVKEIVNYYDWGAKKSVDTGHFTASDLKYLKKHAIIYSDSGKEFTGGDGNGGAIPYGQVRLYEGKSHNIQTPYLKGNNYDFDKYIKKNKFVSGMTEKQVRKIAEYKAKTYKVNVAIANYGLEMDKVTPEYYVREYLKEYGDFAPEPSKQELLTLKRRRIDELHASLKTSSGSQMISLREELVRTSAQTAQLQAEVYEQAIKDKLANAKEGVSQHITELRSAAYTLAHNLSGGEIEGLLSELSFELAWNTGIEATTLSSANSYQKEMTSIAGKLNKAADRIVEIDQKGSQIFGEL